MALAILVPLVSACSESAGPSLEDPDVAEGTFRATVTGALQKTLTGVAFFDMTASSFVVSMNASDGSQSLNIARAGGARPSPRTYGLESRVTVQLAQNGWYGAVGFTEGHDLGNLQGNVTVTSSAANRVAATASFMGPIRRQAGDINIAIDIAFIATCRTTCN